MKKGFKLVVVAAALLAASSSAFAQFGLYDVQGKKTLVISADARNSDLPAIVDYIKSNGIIAVDLSETKITDISQRFKNCNKLKAIILPKRLTSIGFESFILCYSLEQITIPSSVTSIESTAFYGCYRLKQVTFADTSGWYFDAGFTKKVGAGDLASNLKAGRALYKKTR